MTRIKLLHSSFTLLEVVVSLAVFLLVVSTAATALHTSMLGYYSAERNGKLMEKMQNIERICDSAFRNAVPFKWEDENNRERQIFYGEHNIIILAYMHRIGRMESGAMRFLKLYLEDAKLIAAYRKTPILHWDETGYVEKEIIAENISSLTFRYVGKNDDELFQTDTWDIENPNIPLAVQMNIEWQDGSAETWLRRTAGSGIHESFGKRIEFVKQ